MNEQDRPTIVCLCGSTRRLVAFDIANRDETLAGRIVVSIGVDLKFRDIELLKAIKTKEELVAIKDRLDCLHKRKIDLADEILVLDLDDLGELVKADLGPSTNSEIAYAKATNKRIRYWSKENNQH